MPDLARIFSKIRYKRALQTLPVRATVESAKSRSPKVRCLGFRRVVPVDLRAIIGPVEGFENKRPRSEFTVSLKTEVLRDARALAAIYNQRVDRAIQMARASHAPPLQAAEVVHHRVTPAQCLTALKAWKDREIEEARLSAFNGTCPEYRNNFPLLDAHYSTSTSGDGWENIENYMAGMAGALASVGLRVTASHPALCHLRMRYSEAWLAVDAERRSLAIGGRPTVPWGGYDREVPVARPEPVTNTIFTKYKSEWGSQLRQGSRGVFSNMSDVEEFHRDNPDESIENITKKNVQKWISGLNSKISVATIKRKLSALRNYWNYLQVHDYADGDHKPFDGLMMPRESGVQRAERARLAFDYKDIPRLKIEAVKLGNPALGDAINIAAHTGARLGSIISLTVREIVVDSNSGVRYMHFRDKTYAGVRQVPIHSVIAPVIDRLIKSADSDGYILPSKSRNKHGRRSVSYSTAFTRLKNKLGYGPRHDFHSIRHTFTTMFKLYYKDESVTAEILGHQHPSISHGRYGRHTPLAELATRLDRAIRYPDDPRS